MTKMAELTKTLSEAFQAQGQNNDTAATAEDARRASTKYEAEKRELRAEIAELKAELDKQISQIDDLSMRLRAATALIRRDIYSEAVKAYGKQPQLIMAMEEMAELTKELSKSIRGQKNITAISEEMADVEIMLEQLKVIFANRAEVDQARFIKLERLAVRLTADME